MVTPSRRLFLRALLATPLATTVDVERLLWTPSPMVVVPSVEEINAVVHEVWGQTVVDEFFLASPLLAYIRDHVPTRFTVGHDDPLWFEGAPIEPVLQYQPLRSR